MSIESKTINVEPINKNLSTITIKPISQCQSWLKYLYGDVLFTSLKPNQKIILKHEKHPVFDGFVSAYKEHRPITISPDIFWLLILQAFSNHISSNPEKYREMFINFIGQKELLVSRTDLNFYEMTSNNWEEIFPEFDRQISDYTGEEIVKILTPEFTTTTPVSLAVGQLTIMSAMKHYFKYKTKVSGCGFPYITIEGTIDDWTKITNKLEDLAKYEFNWFTEIVIPIIQKIIQTLKGNNNTEFWKDMLRIKDKYGVYDPSFVDGWFASFFPFLKNGSRRETSQINVDEELQEEVHNIPMTLEIVNEKSLYNCEILAGFVGLTQNAKTASIKPEIGWFIKVEGKSGQIRFRNGDKEVDDEYDQSQISSKCCLLI